MNGLAALAIVAGISSCVKDVDGLTPAQEAEQAKDNAELQLYVTIPEGQTWEMASQVEASVTVNGDYGAKYTVSIYENNPFINNTAVLLGRAETVSGGTASTSFTCPNATKSVFVAIKDAKGYSYVKPAVVVDGKIETTFGGEAAAGARTMRAARRSAADDFVIPTRTMPDLSAYIDDAVAITPENNKWAGAEHYLIPEGSEWNDNIPYIQAGSGVSVYVQGTLNINAEQRVNGGCVFIVGPKGTVNIASGQQLVTNANNNAGTVGSFYVYPGGKVQGEGTLQFANGTNTYNYNGGTIDVGTINNNGGTLYNAGTLEADHMLGGAGLSIYENAGKMHIGEAAKGSGTANTRLHNNCWFECDGTLSLRNIQQGSGAYIKALNLEMSGSNDGTGDAAYIWAKGNSLIDIPGAVAFNGIDVVGPTGDTYAYLQFGYAETANGAHGLTTAMNYGTGWVNGVEQITSGAILNNIRLSVDHPDTNYNKNNNRQNPYQLLWDMLNGEMACTHIYDVNTNGEWADKQLWPKQGNGNAVMVAKGQVTDVVTESDCSPGIEIIPPTPVLEKPKVYTYAFEDNMLKGDYDMNDVVLRVSFPYSANDEGVITAIDSTHLKVTLVAAGATFKIKVKMGENYIFGGREVHDLLGHPESYLTINTGSRPGGSYTGDPYTETVNIPSGWDYDFNNLDVRINVTNHSNQNYDVKFVDQKEAPWAIMISGEWEFPTELTNVGVAYPGTSDNPLEGKEYYENSFKAWAATLERSEKMKSWSDFPAEGKTIKTINQ